MADERFISFRDLMAMDHVDIDDEASLDAQLDLLAKMRFTDEEIETMYQSSDIGSLLVVHTQVDYADTRRVSALEKAMRIEPRSALVAFYAVNQCSYHDELEFLSFCSRQPFDTLLEVDAENMLSHYTAAGYFFSVGDIQSTITALENGHKASTYDAHAAEMFAIQVDRAVRVGFPEYVAQMNALGSFVPTMFTKPLFDMCGAELAEKQAEIYSHCQIMGKRMESNSMSVLEKALGIAMQIKALKASEGDCDEVAALELRRDALSESSAEMEEVDSDSITEEMMSQFYSDIFEIGEAEAFRNLVSAARELE